MNPSQEVYLGVDRLRALLRGLLWGLTAVFLFAMAAVIYPRLNFVPSGVSNRLVDLCIAFVALPVPLMGLWCGWKAVHWGSIAVWPRKSGVFADERGMEIRMGPTKRFYDAEGLVIRYPFELLDETEEAPFEAYLPEEEQWERFLPRIGHPNSKGGLQEIILRYTKGTEAELAAQLRPMIEYWRNQAAVQGRGSRQPNS